MLRSRNRRKLIAAGLATLAMPRAARANALKKTVRFGATPVFLDDQLGLISRLKTYLSKAIDADVQFVQRRSYREISDLLIRDELEAAWVCGLPYVLNESKFNLCVLPVYHGKPLYQSYLIVPESDTTTTRIGDLANTVFAFSDPQSNSGYLVPRAELARSNTVPEAFFKKFFFTFGHRKVIEAVVVGLAQGGAVDGYVWDTLALQQPAAVKGVRIAWKSMLHAFPPIVTRRSLDVEIAQSLRRAFVDMDALPAGKDILKRFNLDRFEVAAPSLFDSIQALVQLTGIGRA